MVNEQIKMTEKELKIAILKLMERIKTLEHRFSDNTDKEEWEFWFNFEKGVVK